jgi:DNA-binding CsgD family transcriptional regulator
VLTGPAGVGKTTLALACVEQAEKGGTSVVRAVATHSSRGLPFGAFAWSLPPHSAGAGRDDLAQLLRLYARALVDGAEGRPLLVFIDDAHLLDDGSATLVHQLALTRAATVLATVRTGEAVPDPVVALWKDGLADRIALDVLHETAIEELLLSVLGGPVDSASVRQLIDHSQGNPLYLRELVSGAQETGALEDQGGLWRLRGELQVSPRLVELVELRLGALSADERSALELVAVGEPLGQAGLGHLSGPVALESLERKALITSRRDGRRLRVTLAHPVYGDVVRAGISALRHQAYARSNAEVVEAAGGRRREDTLMLASWRLAGGGGSAEVFLAGAEAALGRHDYSLAESFARAAVSEGAGFEARFLAAEAAHFQGRSAQAERELAALAAAAVTDDERARVALVRFDNSYFLGGNADFSLLDQAAGALAEATWRDELLSRKLFVMCLSRGPRATVEAASMMIERAPGGPLTAGHIGVAHGLARLGRLDEAVQLARPVSGGPAVPAPEDRWEEWNFLGVRTYALVFGGRLREAEEVLTLAYNEIADQPTAEARAYVAGQLAFLHLEQGRPRSAFRRASEVRSIFQEIGRTLHARWGYIAGAQALALTGRADQAAEMITALGDLGLPTVLLDETELLQARAWASAAGGNLPDARQLLADAAELGQEVGDLIGATSALHGLARLGRARQVADRLAELATQIDGDLVSHRAAYAHAVATRNSGALETVSEDFEQMGARLYAAEALAEAAAVKRHAGDPRGAAACERKAARLLAYCEGALTPPVRMIKARALLEPSELDTALQAAAGGSNKEIAAAMHLSVRTVENRLQHVYEKLGISGRHELAAALEDLAVLGDPSTV